MYLGGHGNTMLASGNELVFFAGYYSSMTYVFAVVCNSMVTAPKLCAAHPICALELIASTNYHNLDLAKHHQSERGVTDQLSHPRFLY